MSRLSDAPSRVSTAIERVLPGTERAASAAEWKPQSPRSEFARWPIFCC